MSNQNDDEDNTTNNEDRPIYLTDNIKQREDKLNESTYSIVQPNEINPNSQLERIF